MKITKAVVAVAGSGTRLLPATKSMPKEMLPLVDKPIIQYLVEELVEAGIEDIIMVTKWDKKPLEDHFDRNLALERDLEKSGKKKRLKETKKISEMANFIYVRQDPQYGNGVPILSAASLVKNEPFVFCYGDDLVKSKVSFTKQMVDEYKKVVYPMFGVQDVPLKDVVLYGMMKLKKGTMQLEGIIEKPTVKSTPSRFANFGRMILNQEIIDILKETPIGQGGELWTVDAIEEYIRRGGKFYAKAVEDGEWITTGDPVSYLKAILKYAFDREDINKELKKFLKTQMT